MKKYLSILLIVLLFSFLFVSCEGFDLEALGGIIGDLSGEIFTGDEEEYDFHNGGGGTNETLAGTWKGTKSEFNQAFDLIMCDMTVTIDAEGTISIHEADAEESLVKSIGGTFVLDSYLIKIERENGPTVDVINPWVAIKEKVDPEFPEFSHWVYEYKNAEAFADQTIFGYGYKVEDSVLKYSLPTSAEDFETYYDFRPNSYADVAVNSSFKRTSVRNERAVYDDETITIYEDFRKVNGKVVEVATPAEGTDMDVIFKYSEDSCELEKMSLWYKLADENTLILYWRGDAVKLTRQP